MILEGFQLILVACPICGKQVVEQDINLHLDLQCSGSASASNTASSPVASTSQSHPSLTEKVKEEDDYIVVEDSPVKEAKRGAAPAGPVASIFGGSRRKESEEEGPEAPKRGTKRTAGGNAVKKERKEGGHEEKKTRLNPLLANQPYALFCLRMIISSLLLDSILLIVHARYSLWLAPRKTDPQTRGKITPYNAGYLYRSRRPDWSW